MSPLLGGLGPSHRYGATSEPLDQNLSESALGLRGLSAPQRDYMASGSVVRARTASQTASDNDLPRSR